MPRMAGEGINKDPRVERPKQDNPAIYSDAPAGVSSPAPGAESLPSSASPIAYEDANALRRLLNEAQIEEDIRGQAAMDAYYGHKAEVDDYWEREGITKYHMTGGTPENDALAGLGVKPGPRLLQNMDYTYTEPEQVYIKGPRRDISSVQERAQQVASAATVDEVMTRLQQRVNAAEARKRTSPTSEATELEEMERVIASHGGVEAINQKIAQAKATDAMDDQIDEIVSGKRTKKSGGKGLKQRLEEATGSVGNKAMEIDEAIQKEFRKLYGLTDDGVASRPDNDPIKMAQYLTGRYMHPSHPKMGGPYDFEDTRAGHAAFYGSRAAQAGLMTGAGAGLYNLTNSMMDKFGGPADEPSPTELNPGY